MGKNVLFHMIPSQEAKLRENSRNAFANSNSERLRRRQTIRESENGSEMKSTQPHGVKRSSTNASNKSNHSNESGNCSFVHSNASMSSAESISRTGNHTVNGDDTTISSMTMSTTLGSINHSAQIEDHGVIPRFEVLLDEIPERETMKSPQQKNTASEESAAVNPRLVIERGKEKRRHIEKSTRVAFSGQFITTVDKHVATRPRIRPRRIKKVVQSIEVVKAAKGEDDAVQVQEDTISASSTSTPDRNGVPSASKTKGAAVSDSNSKIQKKKKVYSISAGKLVVNEVDFHEAIELSKTGKVIPQKPPQTIIVCIQEERNDPATSKSTKETVKRLDDKDVAALLHKNRRFTGFRKKKKLPKITQESRIHSRNPVKIISGGENTGAIEILRSPTDLGRSKTCSNDETDEDCILKQKSPPSSPIQPLANLHIIGDNDDIEVVAPASSFDITPSIADRIVSIHKTESQEQPIEGMCPIPSTPPKKFEPVVENPSNRGEGLVDMIRNSSTSASSRASIPSRSSIHASPSRTGMIRSEESAPKNGDQLVYIESEQSTSVVVNDDFRDTSSKKKAGSSGNAVPSSEQTARKVTIEVQGVQKADGNANNIEVSSVVTPTSTKQDEGDVSVRKKRPTMVVKKPTPKVSAEPEMSIFSPPCAQHVAHVNVLGIAGIVVDRQQYKDASPPEEMVAVVGISESEQEFIDDLTAFSSALVHAPNTKTNNDDRIPARSERHIAVWTSNDDETSPGSLIKSKLLNIKSANENSSKYLDLKVALARKSDRVQHDAVVIGKARIEITEDMVTEAKSRSFDIPVRRMVAEGESHIIVLKEFLSLEDGLQKLRVEAFSDEKKESEDASTSAYAIDPLGDSMIRVEVEIKEIVESHDQESFKTSKSFSSQTISTKQSCESSIPSKQSNNYEALDKIEESGCTLFGRKITASASTIKLAGRIDDHLGKLANHFRNRDDTTQGTDGSGISQRKIVEDLKSAVGAMPTCEDLKDIAKEMAMSRGNCFFEEKYDGYDEKSGLESSTRASTEYTRSVNREKDSHDSSWKTNESEDSSSLNYLGHIQFGVTDSRHQHKSIEQGKSCEAPAELVVTNFQRENSGKPSVPSVVENIVEVLSIGGKACGYVSTDDVDPFGATSLASLFWTEEKIVERKIPETVERSDNVSIGDLTAITLEKEEIMEENRKLLLKKLGIPKEVLACASKANTEEGGKIEDYFVEYERGSNMEAKAQTEEDNYNKVVNGGELEFESV